MGRRRITRDRVAQAFGNALVRARTDAGMTQEQLANAAGLHRTTIGLFERGLKCPVLDTVIRLSEALRCTPSDLVRSTVALLS